MLTMTARRSHSSVPEEQTRRSLLKEAVASCMTAGTIGATLAAGAEPSAQPSGPRPWLEVRGIYGGFPQALLDRGETPADYGVNAIWVGSGGLDAAEIERYHKLGVRVFAEFNSMHAAQFLKEHPDAAPIGPDGKPAPPPDGWQGVSPFHAGYRRDRMDEFRRVLQQFEIDGIWLDYHHAHAAWEQAEPKLPDTDFSPTALAEFAKRAGLKLPSDVAAAAALLLGEQRDAWTQFRCDVFTDWVREYRAIVDEVRPRALLGTFHCPWSQAEQDGAIRHKLAIDLPAQAPYLNVLSIMPYHARFGHAGDPAWISRQTQALAELLGIEGKPGEKKRIWPIVQLSDWGERVPVEQVEAVLDHGSRPPATGVMAFHWSNVSKEWEKMQSLGQSYRRYRPA
jgi:hypothetical protein